MRRPWTDEQIKEFGYRMRTTSLLLGEGRGVAHTTRLPERFGQKLREAMRSELRRTLRGEEKGIMKQSVQLTYEAREGEVTVTARVKTRDMREAHALGQAMVDAVTGGEEV